MLPQQSLGPQSKRLVPQHFPSTQVRPLSQQSLCLEHEPPTGVQQVAGSGPTVKQMRPGQQLPPAKQRVPTVAVHAGGSAGASEEAGASMTTSGALSSPPFGCSAVWSTAAHPSAG